MARIAIIPGDGIGADVTAEAVKVLECVAAETGASLDLVEWDLGAQRYLDTGVTITADEMAELRDDYDAIFLGAMGDARVPDNVHARDILLGMRFQLDLYINLRPVQLYRADMSPLRDVQPADVDIVIFRENTEGVYVGMGGNFKKGTPDEIAIEEDVNTRKGAERIIRAAFEYASSNGRQRVTLSDKANAMPHAGGLWRRTFADVALEYGSAVEHNAVYADALAMDMVLRPARYDVIVAPNLFGDILSDVAAALVGGLGLAPSASLHPGRVGLFEPVHGSAPDLVGTDRANPLAAILTAALMLRHLGEDRAAGAVEESVRTAVLGGHTTPDLGGDMGTRAMGDWVCRHLREHGVRGA
ncbi:MAG TPA: isocitrate/isopropylmalate dehydrogenase family protein [Longimicrobiales bacterium]|nr:isocitrate/isopropylmalate dehydrogenase family protein [Longimicrobiales bacterium]